MYDKYVFKCKSNHDTIKFTQDHVNGILVEIWEDFKIPSTPITNYAFNTTHIIPLYPLDQLKNNKDLIEAVQTTKRCK